MRQVFGLPLTVVAIHIGEQILLETTIYTLSPLVTGIFLAPDLASLDPYLDQFDIAVTNGPLPVTRPNLFIAIEGTNNLFVPDKQRYYFKPNKWKQDLDLLHIMYHSNAERSMLQHPQYQSVRILGEIANHIGREITCLSNN